MTHQFFLKRSRRISVFSLLFGVLILLLSACGNTQQSPQVRQVLTLPNVGTQDVAVVDPALGPDSNSALFMQMVYSGLVRFDQDLNVLPDQATWDISADRKTYTFHLKSGLAFSDGTPVTAQTYVYSLTRALLPDVQSPVASFFLTDIVGADDLSGGKAKTLSGVQALNTTTLQITLNKPSEYFLQVLASPVALPVNEKLITQYGQTGWTNHAAGAGIGTGPFELKTWDHNVKMELVPNPHYYGKKPQLTAVEMLFVSDPTSAFKSYRAHQYDLDWNIPASSLAVARGVPGYTNKPLLQSDMLFFDNTSAPFNQTAVRQAFAYAINKDALVKAVFDNSVVAAPTIIPPGMPGYQPDYKGLPYDADKAKALLQSVYPDVSKVPTITFSYPSSQVSPNLAQVLQQMWQSALGIQIKLNPVELNAYNTETANHQIQFGFTQWGADFPDPYDWLALNLLSTAANNNGEWKNPQFDQLVNQAEQSTGQQRLNLYNQAEQIAITDVGWLPLDHQTMSAIIPSYVHGVILNSTGLYFGDWSGVSLSQH